jgi:hypothetical protein
MNNTTSISKDLNSTRHGPAGQVDYQSGQDKNDDNELTMPSVEGPTVEPSEPISAEVNNPGRMEVTKEKGDIFDHLVALGQNIETGIPSDKVLIFLPVRKPKKDEWVRIHRSIRVRAYVYESAEERSWYLISPEVFETLAEFARIVDLSLAITATDVAFIWPVSVPTERRPHHAHTESFESAKAAREEWIQTAWTNGHWAVHRRPKKMPDPIWPKEIPTPESMLRFAANTGSLELIDSKDHPIIQRLLGLD